MRPLPAVAIDGFAVDELDPRSFDAGFGGLYARVVISQFPAGVKGTHVRLLNGREGFCAPGILRIPRTIGLSAPVDGFPPPAAPVRRLGLADGIRLDPADARLSEGFEHLAAVFAFGPADEFREPFRARQGHLNAVNHLRAARLRAGALYGFAGKSCERF